MEVGIGSSRRPPLALGPRRSEEALSRGCGWKVEPWHSAHRVWKQEGRGLCRGSGAKRPSPSYLSPPPLSDPSWAGARGASPRQTTLPRAEQGRGDAPAGRPGPTRWAHPLRGKDAQEPHCGHVPTPVLNVALSVTKLKYCYNLHLCDSSQLTWNLGDKKEKLNYSPSLIQMVKLIVKL